MILRNLTGQGRQKDKNSMPCGQMVYLLAFLPYVRFSFPGQSSWAGKWMSLWVRSCWTFLTLSCEKTGHPWNYAFLLRSQIVTSKLIPWFSMHFPWSVTKNCPLVKKAQNPSSRVNEERGFCDLNTHVGPLAVRGFRKMLRMWDLNIWY